MSRRDDGPKNGKQKSKKPARPAQPDLGPRLGRTFFTRDAQTLARALLGMVLVRRHDDGELAAGVIVETEAYVGAEDLASHAVGGRRTARNEPMYSIGGTSYVYFTYGMHWCFNVVAGQPGEPVAVLVRALEPVLGLERMRERRGRAAEAGDTNLCSGPAKLCQALAIDGTLSGIDLATDERLWISRGEASSERAIEVGPRIGIDFAGAWAQRPLRFWIAANPHVSVRSGKSRKSTRRAGEAG